MTPLEELEIQLKEVDENLVRMNKVRLELVIEIAKILSVDKIEDK